jgi:hypothetical protein
MKDKAIAELESLVNEGLNPKSLDQLYDTLKLFGVILGYSALLDAAVNGTDKERVPAARALINLKEDPEGIAERLRRSRFAHLSIEELKGIVQKINDGETNLKELLTPAESVSNGRTASDS